MNVLLINGSPHEFGSTYTALSEVAGALQKNEINTQIFHIGSKPVQGCTGCGACWKLKHCVIEDELYSGLLELMKKADGIIIGSPVYYAGPNGSLCAILDRIFYSSSRFFRFKPAAAVVCCRRGGASAAFDRLNKYFTISRMPVVSSQYWNAVHGRNPEEVSKDAEGLQIMRTLGYNMAWMLKGINKQPLPEIEQQVMTNNIS